MLTEQVVRGHGVAHTVSFMRLCVSMRCRTDRAERLGKREGVWTGRASAGLGKTAAAL